MLSEKGEERKIESILVLPIAKIPSKCEVFTLLWENFNMHDGKITSDQVLLENLSGQSQVSTLELLLVYESVHMSQI